MTLRTTDRVRLVLPDNPLLDGQVAVVASVRDWGAYLITKVGGGGFRALFAEMVKIEETNGKRPKKAPDTDVIAPRHVGYTGDVCENCMGCRMVRVGTCLRCEDCGSTSGCG